MFFLFLFFVAYFGYNFLTLLKKLNVGLQMSYREEIIRLLFGAIIDVVALIKK